MSNNNTGGITFLLLVIAFNTCGDCGQTAHNTRQTTEDVAKIRELLEKQGDRP